MDQFSSMEIPLLEKKAELFKALGHPLRLSIVHFLAKGESDVSRITEQQNAKISNVSRHLAKLKHAGVVVSRKRGHTVYYGLNLPFVTQMLLNVREEIGRTSR